MKINHPLPIKKTSVFLIFLLLLIFLISFFAYPTFATSETFYLTANGQGVNEGATSGAWETAPTTPQNAMSPAQFNTAVNWSATDETVGKIDPGDTVLLYDDDGNFTTTLEIQGSGLSGKPITITKGEGENPVLNGVETITDSFTQVGETEVYVAAFTPAVDPKVVWEDDNWMDCQTIDTWDNTRGEIWYNCGSTGAVCLTGGNANVYGMGGFPEPAAVFDHSGGTWNKLSRDLDTYNGMAAGHWYWESARGVLYVRATADEDLTTAGGDIGDEFIHASLTYKDSLAPNSCYYDLPTESLYVRTSDGSVPTGLTYAARDFGITLASNNFVTINNLTIKNFWSSSVKMYWSANYIGDVAFTNNTIENIGQNGVLLYTEGNGADFLDNINVSGNSITNHPLRFWTSDINAGMFLYSAIAFGVLGDNCGAKTFDINYNKIDSHATGIEGSGSSGDRDGIFFGLDSSTANTVINIIGNEITGIDHGIFVYGQGNGMKLLTVAYNYIHDISDDGIWFDSTGNTLSSQVIVKGNYIKDVHDDGVQLNSIKATVVNNSIIDPLSVALVLPFGSQGSIIKNNIFTIGEANCTEWGGSVSKCLVTARYPSNNFTFENNAYYTTSGAEATSFLEVLEVVEGVPTLELNSFTSWKAKLDLPDKQSIFSTSDLALNRGGKNECALIGDLLSPSATWSAGVAPKLGGACPEADPLFDIGAFNIVGHMLR